MTEPPRRARSYQRFFAELKRRRVFRSLALYGAVAFGVLQGVDVLVDALRLPGWPTTLVALLAIAGFPGVSVIAWRWQLTRDGLRRTPPAADGEIDAIIGQSPARRWPSGVAALLGIAVFAVGAWWTLIRDAGPAEASVAVLPFADLSEAGNREYFADGITEEILHALVRVPGLRVSSRTSAFAYKGASKDIREIGRELDVAAVLEGSVRQDSGHVRITAQLIDVGTGFHIWSETYTRELRDIFRVQDEIARRIAAVLRGSLAPAGEPGELIEASTADPAAYDEYLKGRFELYQRTPGSLLAAVEHFGRATQIDSAFAPAYAGLGLTYALLPFYSGSVPFEVALERARTAADRAVELNPDLPEAHAAAGQALPFGPERAAAFRRAVQLDPFYAEARQWLGETLSMMGYHDEAVEQSRRALELDSLSRAANLDYGRVLQRARKFEQAEAQFRAMIRRDPTFSSAWGNLANVLVELQDYDGAEAAIEQSLRLSPLWEGLEGRLLRRIDALRRRDTLGVPYELPPEWTDECARPQPFGYLQGVTECLELLIVAGQVERVVERLEDFPVGSNLGFSFDPVWDLVLDDPRIQARKAAEMSILGHDPATAAHDPDVGD